MTNEQRKEIQALLDERGLTFKPLQEEMIDHIACDVEQRMGKGVLFRDALRDAMSEVSPAHFLTLQRDTLLVIDKRFAASQWLSYSAMGALLAAFIFRVFHLQFSEALFILSFVFIATALITGSFSGSSFYKKESGISRVMFTLAGVVVLQLGYAFKILHLPGADNIIIVSTILTIITFLSNAYVVYRQLPGKETMLSFLHEKYTPSIERFLLILIGVMTAFKIVSVTTDYQIPSIQIILLIVIYGAGIQFIAMTWRIVESNADFKKGIFLFGMAVASVCIILPFLGSMLPFEVRVVLILLFTLVSSWLALSMQQNGTDVLSVLTVVIVSLVFITWALIKLAILPAHFNKFVFNIPVVILLGGSLAVARKHGTLRAYMMISLSGYLIEYAT